MSLRTYAQDGVKFTVTTDKLEKFVHFFIHVDEYEGKAFEPATYCRSFQVDTEGLPPEEL